MSFGSQIAAGVAEEVGKTLFSWGGIMFLLGFVVGFGVAWWIWG